MRRSFIRGVFAFGAVAATAFAAYVRFGMGEPWGDTIRAWLLIFAALTFFPLFGGVFSPAAWAYLAGWLDGRRGRPRNLGSLRARIPS
jgi:hypothetical protein